MYSKRLYAGWGDMDFNAHMSNTAYLNKCGDVRMMPFAENGFPIVTGMRPPPRGRAIDLRYSLA
jgi:acyl-CoA thioester hydrolase